MNLNNRHRVAALLEARGEVNKNEIAEIVGLSVSRLSAVRSSPEYRLLVEKYQQELIDRTLEESAELLALFNKSARKAHATVDQLVERADRDSVRLGAAKEILDRATIAPKKREFRSEGESGIVIQLGAQKMGMIIGALEDVGDQETIDLLEMEDDVYELPKEDGEIVPKEAP